MTPTNNKINLQCKLEQHRIIKKYFGNLVHEAAIERPETIGKYTIEYAHSAVDEYKDFLKKLWKDSKSGNDIRPLDAILDKPWLIEARTADDLEGIGFALKDAERRTIWERLTRSNHKDVTYYKGLLQVYTEEVLESIRLDFIEEY